MADNLARRYICNMGVTCACNWMKSNGRECVCGLLCIVTVEEQEEIHQQAQTLAKSMNLSVVRLCFQAFLPDENGRYTIPIDPVFSNKVYDSSKYIYM